MFAKRVVQVGVNCFYFPMLAALNW